VSQFGNYKQAALRLGSGADDDPVNHPSHYRAYPVEVIEITERMNFCLGNVIKYVLRADYKGEPIQDLEKAAWYLRREIDRRKRGVEWETNERTLAEIPAQADRLAAHDVFRQERAQ